MTGYESKKKAASAKTIDEVNWVDHEPDGMRAAAQAKLVPTQGEEHMKDEALKLALEALLNSVDLVVEDAYNAEQLYGSYPTRQARIGGLKVLANKHREAITAAEEALAQPALEQNFCPRCGKRTKDIHTCTPPQENT